MIQSGNNMTVHKFTTDSNNDLLNYRGVYINVCGKYCDMTAMASRTLLVDPKQEQKDAYMVAHDAQELLINSLKIGSTVASAY